MADTGYTVKNDRVQDASPAHGWQRPFDSGFRIKAIPVPGRQDFDQKNLIGQDAISARAWAASLGSIGPKVVLSLSSVREFARTGECKPLTGSPWSDLSVP